MNVSCVLDIMKNSVFFVAEKQFTDKYNLKPGDRIHFRILSILHHQNKEVNDLSESPLILHYNISQSNKVIINFRVVKSLDLEQYDAITIDLIEPERYPDYNIIDE